MRSCWGERVFWGRGWKLSGCWVVLLQVSVVLWVWMCMFSVFLSGYGEER